MFLKRYPHPHAGGSNVCFCKLAMRLKPLTYKRITSFIRRDRRPRLSVQAQTLLYDKGLLIHRKRSPFPHKGRLVGIVSALNDLLIIIYTQMKMHRTTKRVTLSLPLSGKVAFVANSYLRQMTEE